MVLPDAIDSLNDDEQEKIRAMLHSHYVSNGDADDIKVSFSGGSVTISVELYYARREVADQDLTQVSSLGADVAKMTSVVFADKFTIVKFTMNEFVDVVVVAEPSPPPPLYVQPPSDRDVSGALAIALGSASAIWLVGVGWLRCSYMREGVDPEQVLFRLYK